MKLTIDTERNEIVVAGAGAERRTALFSPEGFEILSDLWVKTGWHQRYSYSFTWLGRPIIQLPEDLVRVQEVIWAVQPTVIVETGVAHGGSLIFYAGLLQLMGRGRVIGIDVALRPENRRAIEGHPLAERISLVEGSSVDPAVVARVRAQITADDIVLVILDSDHSYAHVSAELAAYAGMVTPGSYLVATDGIISAFHDLPNGKPAWVDDNATRAAADFAAAHPEFSPGVPPRAFDESRAGRTPTYWPGAWLKRIR
ncbi:MAG: class I SAM-dependent methyltransferase [Alphaproteobacteria bacterium]|nr:class I SAM-dependent methyltransferase [Alphaproteobacteria bacterium]